MDILWPRGYICSQKLATMIERQEITAEEAKRLNGERSASYWSLPIALTLGLLIVTLALNWLFSAPWSVFWWTGGGVFGLFILNRLIFGPPPQVKEGMIKVIRRGQIAEVTRKGNRPFTLNLAKHTDITLVPEAHPEGLAEQNTFTVYQAFSTTYFRQDSSVSYRKEYLIGKEVELDYLAHSGQVIAFKELDPSSNPPSVFVRWGAIQLSGLKTMLSQNKVSIISLMPDLHGNPRVRLCAGTDELFVPMYAKNFDRLEDWMFSLADFDRTRYLEYQEHPPVGEQVIWQSEADTEPSSNGSVESEQLSVRLGGIHIYRNSGFNESIRMRDVDVIYLTSVNEKEPTFDFTLYLHSFQASGITIYSWANGFDKLERWMAKLPKFDEGRYRAARTAVRHDPYVIWVREPEADAKIVETPPSAANSFNLEDGIFLENHHTHIPWGTFGDITRLDSKTWFSMKKTRYPNPDAKGYTYSVANPVILGGLALEHLHTQTPYWLRGGKFNPNWPVTDYWADVSFGAGGEGDFARLKNHLQGLFGEPSRQSDPSVDGDNILRTDWTIGRVTVQISTWKPHRLDFFKHGCRLDIRVEPDVDHLYRDDYSRGLTLHEQLRYRVVPGNLNVASDYTHYPQSRFTPEPLAALLKTSDEHLIWWDETASMIGVANQQYAQIWNADDVKGVAFIGMYWRDSPSGLQLHFNTHVKNNTPFAGYLGEIQVTGTEEAWLSIRSAWEGFFGLPCTYAEDRQYY